MHNSISSVLQFGYGGWETNPNPPKNMNQSIEEKEGDEDDVIKWMFQREFLFYIWSRNIHMTTSLNESIQMRGPHNEIGSFNYSNKFAYLILLLCLRFMGEIMEENKGCSCSLRSVILCFFIWWIRGIHIISRHKISMHDKELPKNTLSVSVLDLLPNDLIEEEFMMRLSVKTLIRLKCVSSHWNNFISNDNFRKRYQSRQQSSGSAPAGFFCSDKIDRYAEEHSFCAANKFLYTSGNYVKNEELESFDYLNTFGYIIAASNGLLLLGPSPKTLYVYDLVSKKHVKLPRHNITGDDIALGFKFEERRGRRSISTNNHQHLYSFKVVCVDVQSKCKYKIDGSSYNVEIYSSETGTWTTITMRSHFHFQMQLRSVSRVCGGVFHWHRSCYQRVVAYDDDYGTSGRVVIVVLPYTDLFLYGKILRHFEVMKDGSLQFIIIEDSFINVWIIKSTSGVSYMDENYIVRDRWSLASSVSLWDIIGVSLGDFGLFQQKNSRFICTDPVNHHIVYLEIAHQLYAYDHCQQKIVFTFSQELEVNTDAFVHFEWPTWPCPCL